MSKNNWLAHLNYDPLPPLINSGNPAIQFFSKRDLLDEAVGDLYVFWELSLAKKIINKQQINGSWKYPSGNTLIRSEENYDQIETYRNLSYLVEMYGLNRNHEAIKKTAEYLFGFQTKEGDIRGIYGNQYTPNYSAAIVELLIKAGYDDDPRTEKLFEWLLKIRQDDGGWTIPFRTIKVNINEAMNNPLIEPDRSKRSSHLATGIVLRCFAAHPKYRKLTEAKIAGELLASRFFSKDVYIDRSTPDFWYRFSYPFWFTDLLSALDSLSFIGLSTKNPNIKKALDWFISQQQDNGIWNVKIVRGSDKDIQLWIALAICRVFKRFYVN